MQTDHPDSERVVPAVAVIADNEPSRWCRVVTCDKLLETLIIAALRELRKKVSHDRGVVRLCGSLFLAFVDALVFLLFLVC